MKRVWLIFPIFLLLALLAYKQFFLRPEIKAFKLLDLPWPAYCEFYENEDAQNSGLAIFAFPSKKHGQTYLANIDGTMQKFKSLTERWKDRDYEWLILGDNKYSIFLDITNHSDVEDIKLYSGSMRVRSKWSSTTINVIGRCGS